MKSWNISVHQSASESIQILMAYKISHGKTIKSRMSSLHLIAVLFWDIGGMVGNIVDLQNA